jgi:transposase-like protein
MMKTPKSATMFAKVDEWKNSGQTLREFASTLGLSKSAFEYWVRKKREVSANSPAFVELSPMVKPRVIIEATPKHPEPDAQAQIVFTFPGGMCIKVYG